MDLGGVYAREGGVRLELALRALGAGGGLGDPDFCRELASLLHSAHIPVYLVECQ